MNANFKELISEELISKIKEFGDLMEEHKKQFEEFQKQIDSFKVAIDKKFKRVDFGEKFYKVICYNGKFIVCVQREVFDNCCNELYDNNNYFLTKKRAQEVADHLNKTMCIERVIDEFPEYEIETYIHAFVPDSDVAQKLRDRLREKLNLTK